MTATGGYPAPGPPDRETTRDSLYAGPPPAGPPPAGPPPAGPPPAGPPPAGPPTGPTYGTPTLQWGQAPQIPMLTAHKPGIVPLRPLQFGDILDGAIKAVRFNPKSMVGLSALVLGAFLIPSAALGIGATHLTDQMLSSRGPEIQSFGGLPAVLVQTLFTTLATAVLSGLLIHVVGQAVLGRKPDIAQTWRFTRNRVPSLLGLVALSLLASLLATMLLFGPGIYLLFNDSVGTGVFLLILGVPAFIAASLVISTKISMAAPAMVLEGHGLIGGLRRSFALTKGSAFWRILGITLLAGLIAGIAGWLLGLPFSIIGTAIAFLAGQDSDSGQVVVTFISHLSALLTGAITTPFVAAVTGLLYIDRRMRLEALDVILLREAQTNPAPRV